MNIEALRIIRWEVREFKQREAVYMKLSKSSILIRNAIMFKQREVIDFYMRKSIYKPSEVY